MDIFDMVKAAPPPQTIAPVDRKISTPSPIAPDSPFNSDLLESGNLSNDDDLDKEATLDESTCQISLPQSSKPDESPFKMPKKLKKYEPLEEKKDEPGAIDVKSSSDEEPDEPTFKKPRKSEEYHRSSGSKPKTAGGSVETAYPLKPHKKRPAENLEDDDEDSDEQQRSQNPGPTKTKAQQKMFNDPEPGSSSNRECRVRVRRLTQLEIDAAFESLAKSPFAHVADSSPRNRGAKGRGRRRRSGGSNPSPPKKQKSPSPNKVHIKVPLQNGAKKRTMHQLARSHTPPPSLSSRRGGRSPEKPKPKSKSKKPIRGRNASQALIQRFGARFFDCVVRLKRTPWPNPMGKKGRPRKSNLSVSFSEAVEILGSAEGHSRRATFGSISSKSSPKPTRLQRVDATGNVLEDIALTSTPLTPLAESSLAGPSTSSGGGSREKGGKRRSCNGSPMGGRLKRPHQRLPLSSLASLRLDDGPNSGEDEEYIVPNELPGIKRPATPPLKKKKISFTTTISDDEDEKPPLPKKPKDSLKKQPKVLKESVIKKAPKEKEKADKSHKEKEKEMEKESKQEKSNEIVKEKLPLATAEVKAADKVEVRPPENEANEVERDGEAQKKSETDAAEEKGDESRDDKAKEEEKPEDEKLEDKTEENPHDAQEEEAPKEDSNKEVEDKAEETPENHNESLQNPTEEEKLGEAEEKQVEVEQAEEFRELASPTQLLVPSATEDNEDDILEIQTSLDDVRQLHTPSSRLSTPKPRSRLDSGESDCSFKSASDHDKQAAVVEATEEEDGDGELAAQQQAETLEDQLTAAITDDELELPADELPAELMTPPSAPRTTNGSNPTSGSSVSAPYYSPIESIPTLDDEVLGQLVEPDFQLNSSRHAISRGTLDDIMTALES